jgi:hypothetical protein
MWPPSGMSDYAPSCVDLGAKMTKNRNPVSDDKWRVLGAPISYTQAFDALQQRIYITGSLRQPTMTGPAGRQVDKTDCEVLKVYLSESVLRGRNLRSYGPR